MSAMRRARAHRGRVRRCGARGARRGVWALAIVAALLIAGAPRDVAVAGQLSYIGRVWTDANGDGLADCGPANPLAAVTGEVVSFDVWLDSEDFTWSSFEIWVYWDPSCFEYVSSEYAVIGDGSVSPPTPDPFTGSVGFSGSGFENAGVSRIARIDLRPIASGSCCVVPILDPSYWNETWCQLYNASGEFTYFREVGASCFDAAPAR